MPTTSPKGEEIVGSLLRGLDVIGILSEAEKPLSLAEVATLADTSRATARRLLLTLERVGYVRTDGRTFQLRPKVMELGDAYLEGLGLPRLHPHLTSLAERVRDTCSLTVLDGDTVVYVDRVKADPVFPPPEWSSAASGLAILSPRTVETLHPPPDLP